ncbi:MAG: transposase [Deltaproteobacteria bacterium]|nr:transposase [Deltaproteobacteria bacterium]
MTVTGWHSRGYVPHWEAGDVPQSLTFRLHDSLPAEIRRALEADVRDLPESRRAHERRARIEAALDRGHGARFLAVPEVADVVERALLCFDGARYRLHAWVVMPTHVHVVVTPSDRSLSEIVHSWKSYSAKAANRILGRRGSFWLQEYFDRVIRDDTHFRVAVEYVENNPVKAGLCASAEEWPWSSARWRAEDGPR